MAKDKSKDTVSFETRLERLRGIVDALERGDLPLEESLALYKEGLALAGDCARQLQSAKNEVRVVHEGLLKEFAALDAAPGGNGGDGQ